MIRKTPAAIVSMIDELLDTYSEVEITAILNERGRRTYRQMLYTPITATEAAASTDRLRTSIYSKPIFAVQ
jgi:hypothetical protein